MTGRPVALRHRVVFLICIFTRALSETARRRVVSIVSKFGIIVGHAAAAPFPAQPCPGCSPSSSCCLINDPVRADDAHPSAARPGLRRWKRASMGSRSRRRAAPQPPLLNLPSEENETQAARSRPRQGSAWGGAGCRLGKKGWGLQPLEPVMAAAQPGGARRSATQPTSSDFISKHNSTGALFSRQFQPAPFFPRRVVVSWQRARRVFVVFGP